MMIRRHLRLLVGAVGLVAFPALLTAESPTGDAKALEGIWTGAWGGGQRDGTVFQPVLAEIFVHGDQIELTGMPTLGLLVGTFECDAIAKQLRIAPATVAGQPPPKPIAMSYELKGDQLTVTDGKSPVGFRKRAVVAKPLAAGELRFVTASGINEAGDLLVIEYRELRVGRSGVTYFEPAPRSLHTKDGAVFQVEEKGLKGLTLAEARRLLREATPVAIAYRPDDQPEPPQFHTLWKDIGSPTPDSDAVRQTWARLLRPGTLVFVLSTRPNAAMP